ncbi:hypothetical protein M0805_005306 [Coniferiporia weirii]|nr:hypothetical protein M0805_005306 [Coniferiporia weirii]
MKAVSTFHQPTSVVASLKTTLTGDTDIEHLVVAKTCILEVFAILPDGLHLQHSLEVWGRIASIQAIPIENSSKHHLLILTDHPDPRLLLFEYAQISGQLKSELKCIRSLSLFERNARPAEFFNGCLVNRKGKVAVVSTYVGKLRILELDDGLILSDFDVSVRELNIVSICFLPTTSSRSVALAILHRDHGQMLALTSHDLSISGRELSISSAFLSDIALPNVDSGSLIPVPPHSQSNWNSNGGVLVLSDSRISFYAIDKKQKRKSSTHRSSGIKSANAECDWTFSGITAWTQADTEGKRYLLGDAFGHLSILSFGAELARIELTLLGEVSPPTSITLLPSHYLFIGSHFGDSQLVRIVTGKSLISGTFLEVVETYRNIAPIVDAVLADTDNSGQPAIVTCSGGRNAGSLRVIRNGANFTEDARICGIPNVIGMWPLKVQYDDEYHCFILITTPISSHLLKLPLLRREPSVLRMTEITGLKLDAPTLAAGNVLNRVKSATGKSVYESGPFSVQVTPSAIVLVNTSLGIREDVWEPKHGCEIVVADVTPSQICIAVSGGLVILFNILGDRILEQNRKSFVDVPGKVHEISALSISPIRGGSPYASFVVLGFWASHEVKTFKLPDFEQMEVPIILPHLPRSLLLYEFGDERTESHPYLVVGLANGLVAYLPFTKGKFGEKKIVALGESPVFLSVCVVNGQPAILASGTRSVLFFWFKDSLSHSPVLLKDVRTASSLHSAIFSSSVVLSSSDDLVIGRVLELDKLHVRTISLGMDNPVKLAYHPNAKLFGVGCIRQERTEMVDYGIARSTFKLFDASDFTATYSFTLEPYEEVTAAAAVNLELHHSDDMYFAVGSMYYDDAESEPNRGRVLIFSTGLETPASTCQNKLPQLLAEADARGCVYALACTQGKLVAAINTGVVLFNLERADDHAIRLVRTTEWNHNYLITSVVACDDKIVTGDAVSSLSVLRLVGDGIITIARDYGSLWPLCIELVDGQSIIGANTDNNLFSFNFQHENDKMLLERDGLYNIDETVNKIIPGYFDKTGKKPGFRPMLLLFTTTGRIAVIIDVDEGLSRHLSCLERNMADVIQGPGNAEHALWRAPSNSRGRSDSQAASVGFLDGDLLERFLDFPASSSEAIRIMAGKNEAERLTMSYKQLRSALESLRSTH